MEALKNAEALPIYPSSSANVLDGKYAVRSTESGHVESHGSEIESNTWFKTPVGNICPTSLEDSATDMLFYLNVAS